MMILECFAAIIFLSWLSLKFYKKSRANVMAPEPSGRWPIIGHLHLLAAAQVPAARTLGAMADKYGPIFSLQLGSHRAVVVSGRDAVKTCFTTHDSVFASRPPLSTGKHLGYDCAVFALAPYGPFWREIRKMVTLELLTNHRLNELRHVRESEVNALLKNLYEKRGMNAPLSEMLESMTMNIILRKLAGKRLHGEGEKENLREGRLLKEAIRKALYLSGLFVVSDAIPWLEWLDVGGILKSMKETFKEIDQVLQQWLQEHILKGNSNSVQSDFIDVMLSVMNEDELVYGHSRDTIIKATVLILILTGSESTAETMIWGFSLLLNNRHSLKFVQEELDRVVGKERWVQESDIENLTYLQAITKETLRLYPPGPLSGPRQALEDCHVGGYFIPKGTRLIVNIWKIQRDPEVWLDPEAFRPERFLEREFGYKGQQHEYMPFSSGRRMCPAVGFGLQVVHLTLARLVQGFDMKGPGQDQQLVDMTEGVGLALPKVHPLEVVLTPRLPTKLYQQL
ncbi:xanthotoxin 5-hydroxylase CYP82C4-like [Impatiens glandulifera]|uniref:xanthotoxin 5-hydroxylase CYP82C4-like n=1 Tax=Impatiens glandulifera TaxID=253017 RepID=UPI001FB07058|nr:xanthotoxin 5-hydroxylase CYP82C4-like [Impatiens glandulifera]